MASASIFSSSLWISTRRASSFLNMRNFMLEPEKDGPIHARNKVVAAQDIAILNELYPRMTPISNTKEVLMPADGPIAAYREWLAKFDDMGWRIDWDTFQQRNGKNTAFAIPSPARRDLGNWVLEPVPCCRDAQRAKLARMRLPDAAHGCSEIKGQPAGCPFFCRSYEVACVAELQFRLKYAVFTGQ